MSLKSDDALEIRTLRAENEALKKQFGEMTLRSSYEFVRDAYTETKAERDSLRTQLAAAKECLEFSYEAMCAARFRISGYRRIEMHEIRIHELEIDIKISCEKLKQGYERARTTLESLK